MLVVGNGISRSETPTPLSQQMADTLLDQHRQAAGYDVDRLARSIQSLPTDIKATTIRATESRLSPVERGRLAASIDASVRTVNGRPFSVGDPSAPPIATWGQQPAGSPYRQTWDSASGILRTTDPVTVRTEIERQLYGVSTVARFNEPDPAQLGLDLGQMALDLTGIVDPTPVSDGTNAVISVGRSIGALALGDLSSAGGHVANAAISAVAIVPAVGDLAKAGKIGKWAQTVADTVSAAAHNPAIRASLEPGLRTIHDAVGKIPQRAIEALPAGARTSLEGMKRQLDDFFKPAAHSAEPPAASYRGTVGGKPVNLPDVDELAVTYVKRERLEYASLRNAFDRGARADFAKSLVATPDAIAAVRRAGMDNAAVARLTDGKIPQGWQVHHKLPLDDGGTNAVDNLVLIQNSPYHTALTNAQRELVGDLPVGGSRQIDFPVPRGSIYPSGQ